MRKGVSIFVLLAVITSIVFGQLGNSGHSFKSPIKHQYLIDSEYNFMPLR